ncbi:MAG: hypothetical protein JRH11_27340, partial [Deltaproteobacteria bacterium]|nr:hypothetical protein [Deltaproteobacteria bacterium]
MMAFLNDIRSAGLPLVLAATLGLAPTAGCGDDVEPTPTDSGVDSTTMLPPPGSEPLATCVGPVDAIMSLAAGETVEVSAKIEALNGIESVTIAGTAVTPDAEGVVMLDYEVSWGVNNVAIEVTDTFGQVGHGVCSFLTSEGWLADGEWLDGSVTTHLDLLAVDDEDPADDLDSLNDLVRDVLEGGLLAAALDRQFSRPDIDIKGCRATCDATVPFTGQCVKAEVEYLSVAMGAGATVGAITPSRLIPQDGYLQHVA